MGKVVVKRDEALNKVGNIFVPDGSVEKPDQGLIEVIGPEYLTESGDKVPFGCRSAAGDERRYRVGDRVMFAQSSGVDFKLGDEEYVLLEQSDILLSMPPVPAPVAV